MRFSREGKRRRLFIAIAVGSGAYFVSAALAKQTTVSVWLPWFIGIVFGLASAHGVRMLLVWAYLKRGLGSDDSMQVEERKQERTRDDANLNMLQHCDCSLIFFQSGSQHGFDSFLINLFTGLDGYSHVAIDCCLRDGENRAWIIESTYQEGVQSAVDPTQNPNGLLSGPQLAPVDVYNGRHYHRVDVSQIVDCHALCECLLELVKRRNAANPSQAEITHKVRYLDLMYGVGSARTVTCSGLVERCANQKTGSGLRNRLRQLREIDELWGELTPNDLIEAIYWPNSAPDPTAGPPQ
jgi:hypothetical protein